jgi:hypothetical protein
MDRVQSIGIACNPSGWRFSSILSRTSSLAGKTRDVTSSKSGDSRLRSSL